MRLQHIFSSLLLCGLSLLLSACWQDSPDESLQKIQQYMNNGNDRAAELSAKALLASAQDSSDQELERASRLLLARTYFHYGDNKNSARFYEALLTPIAANASTVSKGVVGSEDDWHQWLLSAFNSNDRKLISSIFENPKTPFSAKAKEVYKIRQLISEGHTEDALSVMALSSPPEVQESRYVRYQFALLNASNDSNASLQTSIDLTSKHPEFAEAIMLKARLLHARGDAQDALEQYTLYTKLRPADAEAKIYAALTAFQLNQYDVGRKFLQILAKQAGKHPMVLQLQGMLALYDQKFDEAKSYAEQSLSYGLESFINHLVIGVGAYQQKSWEQANRHLALINDRLPKDHFAKKMLVETKLQLDESKEAAQIFKDLDTKDVIDVALANRVSKKLIEQGGFNDASAVQQQVAGIDVEQEDLLLQRKVLSQALKRNEFKQALISSMQNEKGESKNQLRLILLHLADNETDQAQTLAREWLEESPANVNALNASAMVEQRLGNNQRVTDYLNKALAIDPNNIPSLVMELNLARIDDNFEKLLSISNKLLIDLNFHNPMIFNHWLVASHNLKKMDWNQTLALISSDDTDQLEGLFLNFLLQNGEQQQAERYLSEQIKSGEWTSRHWATAIISAATLGNQDLAITRLQEFINSSSMEDEATAAFAVASAAKLGQPNLVISAMESAEAKDITIKNRELIATKAYLQLGQIDNARKSLTLHATEDSAFWELTADIAIAEQRFSDAWQALTSALEPEMRYPLLKKMFATGNKINKRSKVKEHIRQYFKDQPSDNHSRRMVAQWYMADNPRFAIELLDSSPMQEELKKDWVTANNLAWLYHQTGDETKAKLFAQQAIEQAPENPDVIDTYKTVFGENPGN